MRRFGLATILLPTLGALALTGCAGMPQVQVTMPKMKNQAYRGPSMGAASQPYSASSMGGAGQDPYRPQPMDGAAGGFPGVDYSTWNEAEAPYRFYPGDVLTISNAADPALNGDYTVAPDGRISTPFATAPVMVSGQSIDEVRSGLRAAYTSAGMLNPIFNVAAKTTSAITVYVGGEVVTQGQYPITGDANALQAVIQAGGFKSSAKSRQVVILRRGANGIMSKAFDLSANGGGQNDLAPLRRGDVIFVPRSNIAEVGAWMSQIRDALPIQFGYSLNRY